MAVVSTTIAIAMMPRRDPGSESLVMQGPKSLALSTLAAVVPEPAIATVVESAPQAEAVIEAEADIAAMPWPDTRMRRLPPPGAAPEAMGQSMGSPRDGALLRPARLRPAAGYTILDPRTAWGTDNTIERLRDAIAKVRARHPGLPSLAIGDISTERGGPLEGHQSHQAGRDVDVGLVHVDLPVGTPVGFVEGTRDNLDREATYALVAALAATAGEPGGVAFIVLDYNLQRVLRRAAEARGVPPAELDALFQYPRGPSSREGLVRHMPAHRDHMHVRFSCPPSDTYCRDPLIGFGGMEAAEDRSSPPGI